MFLIINPNNGVSMSDIILWLVFVFTFFVVLFLDLFVFFKKVQEINVKKALILSGIWMSIAFLYGVLVWFSKGGHVFVDYVTAYLVEWSLSVDNLFVFLVIFSFFGIPKNFQHKVLFWGVIGAVVFRGLFIFLGVAALNAFEWLFIVFGLFLIYTGVMLIFKKEDEGDIEKKFIYRFAKKYLNFTSSFEDGKFFVVRDKKILFTPLFLCLLVVEFTDIVFAIDSIPAVLGITTNLLVVYTSNIFAVMGLRSMYFALAGIMHIFAYLKYGLSIILSFIGLKMILKELFHISIASYVSLAIVLGILVISIALSLIFPPKFEEEEKV